MTAPQISPTKAEEVLDEARKQGRPWVELLARIGYFAKGLVYIIIGILALQAAFGRGGQTTDSQGALHKIAGQPFGSVLLGLVGIGLVGYALWRLVEATLDPDNKGTDAKGVLTRIGYAASGIAYGGLAFTAFKIVLNMRSGDGNAQRDWTARLLAQPFGQWLVGLVAVVVMGVGLNAFHKAYSAKFRDKLNTSKMSATENRWATIIGRIGYTARGVVMLLIGWFFIQAARQADASQSGGLDRALDTLAKQSHGPLLLGVVAVGLMAYGIYAGVEGKYRRI